MPYIKGFGYKHISIKQEWKCPKCGNIVVVRRRRKNIGKIVRNGNYCPHCQRTTINIKAETKTKTQRR